MKEKPVEEEKDEMSYQFDAKPIAHATQTKVGGNTPTVRLLARRTVRQKSSHSAPL